VRKALIVTVVFLLIYAAAHSQETEFDEPGPVTLVSQPYKLVDLPTAGVLPRGAFRVETDVYADGGVLLSLAVGLPLGLNVGISYGGANIIGSDDPVMNPDLAANVKARIIGESMVLPAIAVGFDSQGYGEFLKDKEKYGERRYIFKSRGVYAVASKNWELVGPLSLHGGLSYSLEDEKDNDPTVFIGLLKSLGKALDFSLEYDFAYNDNEGECEIIENRGYLNAAVVWHVNENLSVAVKVRDIATKSRTECEGIEIDDVREWNRGLSITYRDIL
jgi:hypothetical protein